MSETPPRGWAGLWARFWAWWEPFSRRRTVAHIIRAIERYTMRMGDQFGAAVTYFLVLSIVPLAMFSFAVLGMVLTVLRPEWLDAVQRFIAATLGDATLQGQVSELITGALRDWRAVGVIGLLIGLYTGVGWVGSLRNAVRAQFRARFDVAERQVPIHREWLTNLWMFGGLLVAVAATFTLSTAATALTDIVLAWFGLSGTLERVGLRVVSVLASILAGWLTYLFIYRVMPERPPHGRPLWQGALIGSVGLAVLQYLTSLLVALFGRNLTAAVFGPVVVIMLFFNLFARLTLYVAAWIATWEPRQLDVFEPMPVGPVLTPPPPGEESIPLELAADAVRAGAATGWVLGAATGMGLGAAWVRFVSGRGEPRPRR